MKVRSQNSLTIRLINNPGCLIRVALVLERRGYTIESLQMNTAPDGYSEMSLLVSGEPEKWEQIQKQLSKLIDVIFVREGSTKQGRKTSGWTNSITRVLTRSI